MIFARKNKYLALSLIVTKFLNCETQTHLLRTIVCTSLSLRWKSFLMSFWHGASDLNSSDSRQCTKKNRGGQGFSVATFATVLLLIETYIDICRLNQCTNYLRFINHVITTTSSLYMVHSHKLMIM